MLLAVLPYNVRWLWSAYDLGNISFKEQLSLFSEKESFDSFK